jgi:hypothetical protein
MDNPKFSKLPLTKKWAALGRWQPGLFFVFFQIYMRGTSFVFKKHGNTVSGSESDAAQMKNIHCKSSENDGKIRIWTARNSLAAQLHHTQ